MYQVGPPFVWQRWINKPATGEIFTDLWTVIIDFAAFSDGAMLTPSPRRFFDFINARKLTTKRAGAACSHASVILIAPAAIPMLSADLQPIAAVHVPYANRVPPADEFHKFQPSAVAAAVAVTAL
jgi:hypothetical protein